MARIPASNRADAARAVDGAAAAFPAWAELPPAEKQVLFLRAADIVERRRGDLHAELTEAGLEVTDLVGVEGPAMVLPDLDVRMEDRVDRAVILDTAGALERVPELIGFGPHLLATAILPATR
jgi:sugar phosphate isomerase/epimerase